MFQLVCPSGARFSLGGKPVLPHIRSKERLASRFVVTFKTYCILLLMYLSLWSRLKGSVKLRSIIFSSLHEMQTFVLLLGKQTAPIIFFKGSRGHFSQSSNFLLNGGFDSSVLKCRDSCQLSVHLYCFCLFVFTTNKCIL